MRDIVTNIGAAGVLGSQMLFSVIISILTQKFNLYFLSLEAAAATTMSLARASLQQIGIWKCRPSENVGPRKRMSFGKVREEVKEESVENKNK